jgi:hypothetical protein
MNNLGPEKEFKLAVSTFLYPYSRIKNDIFVGNLAEGPADAG